MSLLMYSKRRKCNSIRDYSLHADDATAALNT